MIVSHSVRHVRFGVAEASWESIVRILELDLTGSPLIGCRVVNGRVALFFRWGQAYNFTHCKYSCLKVSRMVHIVVKKFRLYG